MRLRIAHTTSYGYQTPIAYALQQLRLTPKSHGAQRVVDWRIEVTGGRCQVTFDDAHRNTVNLISFDPGLTVTTVHCEGEVDLTETHGIVGPHTGFMPLWMFERTTALTRAGSGCRRIVQSVPPDADTLARLHGLSNAIREAVAYETGVSHVGWTAEDAVAAGHGVCQDHAHVFLACARLMGVPARYVSGYLMMDDRVSQEATHAWVEAYVPDLGWVGFDVSNGISPDKRYVRVATGLDYAEAAPVSGLRMGTGDERMTVSVEVQQVQQ